MKLLSAELRIIQSVLNEGLKILKGIEYCRNASKMKAKFAEEKDVNISSRKVRII